MKDFDVYANLDHLHMLNFSVETNRLKKHIPNSIRLISKNGFSFPSIVLPSIKDLRHTNIPFPKVDYQLMGLRILVEGQINNKWTKGIYFHKLIMDPNTVRYFANLFTSFVFEKGTIQKNGTESKEIVVKNNLGDTLIQTRTRVGDDFPQTLTKNSVFQSPEEAMEMYNDITYGFIPEKNNVNNKILQIADPHPNYIAWPFKHLEVERIKIPLFNKLFDLNESDLNLEPCYYVGTIPRYWRWL